MLHTNAPHHVKFQCARPSDVRKKRYNVFYNCYTLQYFGATGDSLGQRSPLLALMHRKAPSINLSSLVDFVDGVTDTHKTVNDICIPRGDNKEKKLKTTRMWASAQRAVTLPRRETR